MLTLTKKHLFLCRKLPSSQRSPSAQRSQMDVGVTDTGRRERLTAALLYWADSTLRLMRLIASFGYACTHLAYFRVRSSLTSAYLTFENVADAPGGGAPLDEEQSAPLAPHALHGRAQAFLQRRPGTKMGGRSSCASGGGGARAGDGQGGEAEARRELASICGAPTPSPPYLRAAPAHAMRIRAAGCGGGSRGRRTPS